jgi:hypothetical protein
MNKIAFDSILDYNIDHFTAHCKSNPSLLADMAYAECNFTLADKAGLDRLIYQAITYEELLDMFSGDNDMLSNIARTIDDKYKHDSKYRFKWEYTDEEPKVYPEPITVKDIEEQAVKDADKISHVF